MPHSAQNRYWAQIAAVPCLGKKCRTLYHYVIREVSSGDVMCEGHAGDPDEAESTAQAHIEYLQGHAPAHAA